MFIFDINCSVDNLFFDSDFFSDFFDIFIDKTLYKNILNY